MITTVSGVLLGDLLQPLDRERLQFGKDITYVVFAGKLARNMRKWAGEGMILFVLFHMARVFYTGSYKSGREFNWLIGIVLLIITFGINLTGYILPLGPAFLLGLCHRREHHCVAERALLTPRNNAVLRHRRLFQGTVPGRSDPGKRRSPGYIFFHIMLFPILLFTVLGAHFWRIRKDGGLTKPENFLTTAVDGKCSHCRSKKGGIFSTNKTYGLMELAKRKNARR